LAGPPQPGPFDNFGFGGAPGPFSRGGERGRGSSFWLVLEKKREKRAGLRKFPPTGRRTFPYGFRRVGAGGGAAGGKTTPGGPRGPGGIHGNGH